MLRSSLASGSRWATSCRTLHSTISLSFTSSSRLQEHDPPVKPPPPSPPSRPARRRPLKDASETDPSTSLEDRQRALALAARKRRELRQLEQLPSQTKSQVIENGVPTYHFNPPNAFYNELNPEHVTWRRTTALEISNRYEPPMRVKMLVRDFIHDSLYNRNYGYFSSPQLSIFTTATDKGYDFSSFRSAGKFSDAVADRYQEYLQKEEEIWEQDGDVDRKGTKEVWHTPGELFKPWYGRAVARCLVSDYKLRHYPYEDLIIYEMGAGNGTLMANILDYIKEDHPDVYERTSYRIIEISQPLSEKQKAVARKHGHRGVVEIVNQSVFDWDEKVLEPCIFLAMEVLDNFAHDVIRYDLKTGVPMQGIVIIDDAADFQLVYEPLMDPLIQQFLDLRSLLPPPLDHSPAFPAWFANSPTLRSLRQQLPFAPNLSKPEYIPTKALQFMEVLRDKFPQHRLLMSDFDALPDAVEGHTAPVVQTRWKNVSVPVSTFMVRQGFFDIFFPTNFQLFRSLYALVQALPSSTPSAQLRISPLSSSQSRRLDGPSPTGGQLPSDFFSPNNPSADSPIPTHSELKAPAIRGGGQKIRIYKHEDFLAAYGAQDLDRTKVQDGTNVMLKWYQNASFLF